MMQDEAVQQARRGSGANHLLWLGPLLYMAFVGLYFVGRYGRQWAEADSTTFINVVRPIIQEGRLLPVQGALYPNGYAYQAISAFIVGLSGLDLVTLQQIGYPLIAPLVVLPAWMLYRELTGSDRGATITTILLFTQPEFLFVILRSSHEKFTRALMLLCLFLLVRSFKLRDQPWLLTKHVALFYIATFAFIASNNLLAHSFIFAVASALVLGKVLEKRNVDPQPRSQHILQRFRYVTLVCLGVVHIFTFYIYPPAQHDILVLRGTWDRLAALFLDMQTTGGQEVTNAYAQVQLGWINLYVYFLVSIANWIILAASFFIWAYQGLQWLGGGKAPKAQGIWLLWLFYGAFAAQGMLSAVIDASGALGSNLQHRLFPSFSIFAVAVVGAALNDWRPRRFVMPIRVALAAGIFGIAVLSVLKATNEPLVSNKWTFYRSSEIAAVDWSDTHLKNSEVWTEFDERLAVAYATVKGETVNHNNFRGSYSGTTARSMVVTEVTHLRSSRLGLPIPIPPDALRVYDNGEAELYHLRPRTPYQR